MMCRAEVILITAQRGVNMGFIEKSFMPFVILLVIVSSFITPILLKLTYKNKIALPEAATEKPAGDETTEEHNA